MAITSVGYGGTINEVEMALTAGSFPAEYGVLAASAWKVTAAAGMDRGVAIAPGTGYGHFVTVTSDTQVVLQGAPVSSGSRWDTVVMRRDWQPPAGESAFVLVQGSTSQAIAAGRLNTPGVEDDQPVALVRFTAGQTAPTQIIDLRCWSGNAGLIAASADALAYLGRLGSRVTIGDTVWTRAIDPTGSLAWSPAYAGSKKSRFINIAASGTLNGAVDIVPAQPLPASPFGSLGFQVTVTASISTRMAAGRGAVLELLYDGVSFAEDRASNDGVASALITLSATLPIFVDAGGPHTIRARLTSLAGEITVYQVGYVLIEAEPRGAL